MKFQTFSLITFAVGTLAIPTPFVNLNLDKRQFNNLPPNPMYENNWQNGPVYPDNWENTYPGYEPWGQPYPDEGYDYNPYDPNQGFGYNPYGNSYNQFVRNDGGAVQSASPTGQTVARGGQLSAVSPQNRGARAVSVDGSPAMAASRGPAGSAQGFAQGNGPSSVDISPDGRAVSVSSNSVSPGGWSQARASAAPGRQDRTFQSVQQSPNGASMSFSSSSATSSRI